MSRVVVSIAVLGVVAAVGWTAFSQPHPLPGVGEGPRLVCEITDPRINEASGIIPSRKHAGHFYVHNDSDGQPAVYLIDGAGGVRAVVALEGAINRDWEDIAFVSPRGPQGSATETQPAVRRGAALPMRGRVIVGDIGDNARRRPGIALYAFAEPDLPDAAGGRVVVSATAYMCQYESGPRNAEALIVSPRDGTAYIFSKRDDGRSDLFALRQPWDAERVNVFRRVGRLRFPTDAAPAHTMVTAADISPDGARIVTRAYWAAWEWTLPTRATDFEQIFGMEPKPVSVAVERQGEAIAYGVEGRSIFTISEGSPTNIWETALPLPSAMTQPAHP